VHFVEEEPIAMNSIVRLLSASNNQSESVQSSCFPRKERKKERKTNFACVGWGFAM